MFKKGRIRVGRRLAVFSALGLLVACARGSDESAITLKEAVSQSACVPGSTCTLTYELPSGIAFDRDVLVAHNQLSLGDRASVVLENGALGPVANTGTGTTDIGANATVAAVAARGAVSVRSNATVTGTVNGSSVSPQQGAHIGATAGPVAAPAKVTLSVQFPGTSNGDKNLQPNQSLQLAPGRYGTLTVNRAATLKLSPGTFYLDGLQVESGGNIQIDARQGTVVLFIRSHLVDRGTVTYLGQQSDALIAYIGTEDAFLEGELDATVLAPAAGLTIGPADNHPVTYDGLYFANNVTVRPGQKIRRQQLSLTGAAIGGVGTTYTGNGSTQLPRPMPDPTGKTARQYMDDVGNFIKSLRDSGYRGPAINVDAPPDYKGKERVLDNSIASQIPNPPRAPAPGSTDDLVATAKPGVVAAHPETQDGFVSQPPAPPTFCPLGEGTAFPPQEADTNTPDTEKALNQPFGDPKPSSIPDFDAWFGGHATGGYGFSQALGLHANLHGDFIAGFSVFGVPEDLVDFEANAFAQGVKPANGDQFGANASVTILGDPIFNYDFSTSLKPWHGDFCTSCTKNPLLPQDVTIPVAGIVSVFFNAGLEAALPASLEPTATGPLFTFAPMFRAFAIVGAEAGEGIRVRVEGDVDVLRIDAPVTVGEKFDKDSSPSVCAASIDPVVDVKITLSTLNGEVFIKVQVFAGIGYVDLLSWKLFSWDGFHYDLPVAHHIFDGLSIPLSPSDCQLDTAGCQTATAQHLAAGLLTPSAPATSVQVAAADYFDTTRELCKGQYLLELTPDQLQGKTLQIEGVWDPASPATNGNGVNICAHQRARISVFGNDGSSWKRVDFRDLQGVDAGGISCDVSVFDNGQGDGTLPSSQTTKDIFITPSKYPGGVRISELSAQTCNPVPLRINIAEVF